MGLGYYAETARTSDDGAPFGALVAAAVERGLTLLPRDALEWQAQLLPAALGQPCPLGCGRVMDETSQLDHIIARAQGGQTVRENVRIVCKPCNGKRGSQLGRRMQSKRTARPHPARRAADTPQPPAVSRHSRVW